MPARFRDGEGKRFWWQGDESEAEMTTGEGCEEKSGISWNGIRKKNHQSRERQCRWRKVLDAIYKGPGLM
jgi:hypothetical protein